MTNHIQQFMLNSKYRNIYYFKKSHNIPIQPIEKAHTAIIQCLKMSAHFPAAVVINNRPINDELE